MKSPFTVPEFTRREFMAHSGKAAGAAETKRKRGSEVEQRGVEENSEEEGDEEVVKPVKRGRGRPPKEKSAVAVAVAAKMKTKKSVAGVNADGTAKRGRGRPPKAKASEE